MAWGITTAQFRALLSPRDLADIEGGHTHRRSLDRLATQKTDRKLT